MLCVGFLFLSSLSIVMVSAVPNFVFIMADDLGFNDVGWKQSTNSYTPELDALLTESLEFKRFYVYPKCSPTRTSLMTGRMAHNIGMQEQVGINTISSCGIEPAASNLFWSEKLKACGQYNNYYLGKWHMGLYKWAFTPIFRGGYDYFKGYLSKQIDYFNFSYEITDDTWTGTKWFYDWRENTDSITTSDTYTTTAIGDKAVEIIEGMATSTDPTWFTLMVAFEAPHAPIHQAPDPHHDDAVNNGVYATTGAGRRKKYNGMVRAMDYEIGRIINALKNTQVNNEYIWDNTYVMFWSDNGAVILHGSNYPLRGAKSNYFEGGIRVPALISGGLLDSSLHGTSYPDPIHITDVYPTIMELIDQNTADLSLDGTSFASVLDPATSTTTRDSIVISVSNFLCSTSYTLGSSTQYVCGGIIKKVTNVWYKLVIGKDVMGDQDKYGWVHLDNQANLPGSTTDCDPNNQGLTEPTFHTSFINNNCPNNDEPCLFNLDDDPCEYNDIAATETSVLADLMADLMNAFNNQVTPFWQSSNCTQHTATEVYTFWDVNNDIIQPFAQNWDNPPATDYSKANTAIYIAPDTCSPTKSPTAAPTLAPTAPTKSPVAVPTLITLAPTLPTPGPTSATNSPTLATSTPTKNPTELITTYVNTKKLYNAAEKHCKDSTPNPPPQLHLMTITNDASGTQRDTLAGYLLSTGDSEAWIGLYYDTLSASFQWKDGTACESATDCTTYWANNQPDVTDGHCVVIIDNGQFRSKSCTVKRKFFCEI